MAENLAGETWVVYLPNQHKLQPGMRAVCPQAEWDAMESAKPGHHTLVRAGISTETEAEKLARGTSGDPPARRR